MEGSNGHANGHANGHGNGGRVHFINGHDEGVGRPRRPSPPPEHHVHYLRPIEADPEPSSPRPPSPPPEHHVHFPHPIPPQPSTSPRPPSPPPSGHVYFEKPVLKDKEGGRSHSRSPPPSGHVYFEKPVLRDDEGRRSRSRSPPPSGHVYFEKPVLKDDEGGSRKVPSPPPDHHVHFEKPVLSDDEGASLTSSRKTASPPPENHVYFEHPMEIEHETRHFASPPPEHHVYFESGPPLDDSGHVLPHRKLESPPPTPVVDTLEEDDDVPLPDGPIPVLESDPSLSEDVLKPIAQYPSNHYPKKSILRKQSSNFSSSALRGNLTRTLVNRDPNQYYEIRAILGVGSMGSVAKVRKRQHAIGGSARQEVCEKVRRQQQFEACFQIPWVGGIFQWCLKPQYRAMMVSGETSEDSTHHAKVTSVSSLDGTDLNSDMAMTFAMKSIHLSRVTDKAFIDELKNEITILKSLDHPHVVRAIETYEHRSQLFVIMELCSGGDLYTRDPYTEEEAARIVSSVLGAVSYMHERGIVHRDLKYENILFVNDSPHEEVKLIDFGLSHFFGKDELTDGVGTIYTMAPEVLQGSYTKSADLWSIGVIAYMLVSSQMPFYGRVRAHIVEQILSGRYQYRGRRWKRISKQAKAFIDDLLVLDPNDRATPEEAMSSTWLNRRHGATVRNPHVEEMIMAKKSLMKFAKYSKLRKVALMVVAHKSTSAEIGILRKIYQKYDTKGDGQLSYDEFKAAVSDIGMDEGECQEIFDAVDMDGTGKIRYTEFLAATIEGTFLRKKVRYSHLSCSEAHGTISEERLAEAFDRLDSDDSGFISAENLLEILGDDFDKSEIEAIIGEVDPNHDGKISYSEFLALWEERSDRLEDGFASEINEIKIPTNKWDSERSVSVSDLSATAEDVSPSSKETHMVARANFINQKKTAEARLRAQHGPNAVKSELTDFDSNATFEGAQPPI